MTLELTIPPDKVLWDMWVNQVRQIANQILSIYAPEFHQFSDY